MPTTNLLRRRGPAALVFLVSLAVYLKTLCPTVFVEGTGENIVAAWTLGVPHPPGFPLFCLLAKLFATLVAVGSVAYRVNLYAAVMGALAAAVLYEALRLVPLRAVPAAAAALTFAFSATFWRQATIAEVYTTSFLLVGLQFVALLRWRASARQLPATSPAPRKKCRAASPPAPAPAVVRDDRLLLWFSLAFGLGLAVHYQHALLLPGYLVFLLLHDRRVFRRAKLVLSSIALVFAGFSLHLYAPLRALADPPLNWGHPATLKAWLPYLTAEQYRGRMFHLPLKDVLANLLTFLRDLPAELWWLGLAFVAVGLIVMMARDRRLLAATAVTFLIAVVWAVNYNIPWEIDVYYLPALFILALWLGFGLQAFTDRVPAKLAPVAAVALLVPLAPLLANFRANDLSQQRFALDSGLDVLDQLPRGATLLLPETNPTFVLLYLTQVEGRRPDVQLWSRLPQGVVPVKQAVYPADEVSLTPEPRFLSEFSADEPVFAIEARPRSALPGIAQIPWACLYRLVPAGERGRWLAQAPDPREHLRFDPNRQALRFGYEHRLIAARYLLVRADWLAARGDAARADALYQQALTVGEEQTSIVLQVAGRYTDSGQLDRAAALYRRALVRKDNAELRDRLGSVYGRQGKLDEAKAEFLQALSLDPNHADAHANLASVYGRAGDLDKAIAELELALRADPYHLQALKNLSFAYLQKGRPADARPLLERAAALDPGDQQVQELLRRME